MVLVDFSVRNFGPFKDRVTLSMGATALKDEPDNVFPCEQVKEGLLTSSLIYGANAAGKSYLIKAMSALQIMLSRTYPTTVEYSAYQPFRLSKDTVSAPVEMRIRMIIGGIFYDYAIAYDHNTIVSESLHHYPKGRKARVFVRTSPSEFTHGDRITKSKTNPSTPYLVVASELNDGICSVFRREILTRIVILDGNPENLVQVSCDFISRNEVFRDYAMRALRIADLGITDYMYDEKIIPVTALDGVSQSTLGMAEGRITVKEVYLKHDLETDGMDESSTLFPMDIESSGTKSIFGLIGPLVDILKNGGVLMIDEFGSNLHPLITRWLVGQFSNESNPNHSQLIVNTHDISLMDIHDLVRRDQIWFVNKDRRFGNSELYSLVDFNDVRKIKGIDKAYLSGRFDAVPSIRTRDVIE